MSNGMKQSQNPRRTRGHRGGRRPGQQGGRNTNFDSNGPDGRIRGNASQVIEKYQALGRDALLAGDRIAAENFFQHAEHYFRVMNANGGEAKAKQTNGARRGNSQDEADSGNDSNGARPATTPTGSTVENTNDSLETVEDRAPDVTPGKDTTVNEPKVSSGVSAAPSDEGLMRALGEDSEDDQVTA